MIKPPSHTIVQICSLPLEEKITVRPLIIAKGLSKIYLNLKNETCEDIFLRKGRNVAFLTCVRCMVVDSCIEIHS